MWCSLPTTSLGDSFIFERLPCIHGNLDSCHGSNAGGVKIEPTNRHDIHKVAIYEIVGHVPYNLAPRMSAFFSKCLQKSREPNSTGVLTMVWKPHVSTVYMDLTFMLTK